MSDMKIELIRDLPVGKQHGLTKGRVLKAKHKHDGVWVDGDAGAPVKVLPHEYKLVKSDDD